MNLILVLARYAESILTYGVSILAFKLLLRDSAAYFNPLNTKRRLLYLKTQFVPRSKHFSSRL